MLPLPPQLTSPTSTLLDSDQLRDSILGLLYGSVLGDTLGLLTLGLAPEECAFHYGQGLAMSRWASLPPGYTWSRVNYK